MWTENYLLGAYTVPNLAKTSSLTLTFDHMTWKSVRSTTPWGHLCTMFGNFQTMGSKDIEQTLLGTDQQTDRCKTICPFFNRGMNILKRIKPCFILTWFPCALAVLLIISTVYRIWPTNKQDESVCKVGIVLTLHWRLTARWGILRLWKKIEQHYVINSLCI